MTSVSACYVLRGDTMEDVSFPEWSGRLESSGTNHWLPAYGYQQPALLQQPVRKDFLESDDEAQDEEEDEEEEEDDEDEDENEDEGCEDDDDDDEDDDDVCELEAGGGQPPPPPFAFLETILEETSDDLRSESDRGWADSDSDAASSVIHIAGTTGGGDWSGSERDRDSVTRQRRRRRHSGGAPEDSDPSWALRDGPAQDECMGGGGGGGSDECALSLSSRSSSLLQFESLERHCEDVFRTSATADPFHSPSSPSQFSFDSLESTRWRLSASPDSLDEYECSVSSEDGSDDTLRHSSWSSLRSSSRLRSFRSFDSLNLIPVGYFEKKPEKTAGSEKTGGAPAAASGSCKTPTESAVKPPQRSAENLSEDSGFGDHAKTAANPDATEQAEDSASDSGSCYSESSGADESSLSSSPHSQRVRRPRDTLKLACLSERKRQRGWQTQEAKFTSSAWQSAPSLMEEGARGAVPGEGGRGVALAKLESDVFSAVGKFQASGPHPFVLYPDQAPNSGPRLCSVPDNLNLCVADSASSSNDDLNVSSDTVVAMNAKSLAQSYIVAGTVASTPNLNSSSEFIRREKEFCTTSTVSIPLNDDMDTYLDSGSTALLSKSLTPFPGSGSNKGVHFCPVVSEVSWRDSYSDDEPQDVPDDDDLDRDLEEELRASETYRVEEPESDSSSSEEPVCPPPSAPWPGVPQRVQACATVGNAQRERLVSQPGRREPPPDPPERASVSHVTPPVSDSAAARHSVVSDTAESLDASMAHPAPKKSRLGVFFQRFSLRRLSGKKDDKKKPKSKSREEQNQSQAKPEYEDVKIIPLHPEDQEEKTLTAKPPLPPRVGASPSRRQGAAASPTPATPTQGAGERPEDHVQCSGRDIDRGASDRVGVRSDGMVPAGLLETDLDTAVTTTQYDRPPAPAGKKARSLQYLGPMSQHRPNIPGVHSPLLQLPASASSDVREQDHRHVNHATSSTDSRAKSMEFLLDKDNQAAIQPPENELQKVAGGGEGGGAGGGERALSEHQLRVQRSLQRLHVPDWYKNSAVAAPGFLLRRSSADAHHWPGLASKTTSLSSLGGGSAAVSPASATASTGYGAYPPGPGFTSTPVAHSPTGQILLSPSPTPHSGSTFSRWSTSRLCGSSANTSASTSPGGSARSSFNYRQPYLGWRSQERLARPRTPAERLAAGLLADKSNTTTGTLPSPTQTNMAMTTSTNEGPIVPDTAVNDDYDQTPQVPNLTEVRTSIKEVTSAIVHYVSGVRDDGSSEALTPHRRDSSVSPRSTSPRGSGRLCWLESSFVGSRPLDSPETPVSLAGSDPASKMGDLYLELNKAQGFSQLNGEPQLVM